MTRTARAFKDGARSTKTHDASTWEDLRPGSSSDDRRPGDKNAFKFGSSSSTSDSKRKTKKEDRGEKRRVKRVVQREQAKACFHCRGQGHVVADCPKMKNVVDHAAGICFKCGSTEHSLQQCRAKVPDGQLPYAKCFICGEMGHLSKSCPDNPRGLYPMGGGCDICGSVEHFKRDCTETKMPATGQEDVVLEKLDEFTNIEEEVAFLPPPKKKTVSKVKVVKF